MPGFDDRLKQHLERAAPPADPSGAFDRVVEKKIRRRMVRRFQAAGLVVAVIAATIGGTWVLVRAFESGDDKDRFGGITPTPGPVSNGLIAYASNQSGNWDIWTASPDGARANNITAESLANETEPAWSPDGTEIAFVSDRNGNPDIYVMTAEGARIRQLTNDSTSESAPAWSPDGTKIAYVSGFSGDECVSSTSIDCATADIFVMSSDGSAARDLTPGPTKEVNPTWAPDGSRIAFARYVGSPEEPPADSGIYAMNSDGSDVTRLTRAHPHAPFDDYPDWSADGTRIVFQRGSDILVLNLSDMEATPITGDPEGLSGEPAWSPDGKKIVFERGLISDRSYEVSVMDADGSGPTGTGLIGVAAVSEGQQDPFPINPGILPDWQPILGGTSPSPSPGRTPRTFPSSCDPSIATGDFDGDGQPDTATVAKTECLVDPGDQGDRFSSDYSLYVQWASSEGVVPLPDCENACVALASTDLNLDGTDELVLKVAEGASTYFVQIYELPASEAFGDPARTAPPGDAPGFPPGETARFAVGGSATHYAALGCLPGNNRIIAEIAELNSEQTEYTVHETVLRFDPIDSPPFGQFTVTSTKDRTESFDNEVGPGDRFEPGGPCWMENPSP